MLRPQEQQIRKLCAKRETISKARELLHSASVRTGPGTGYNLGEGKSGLPAICAFIASQELGNGDVSEKIAQTASCLKPILFKTTLKTVRSVLATADAQTEEDTEPLTYEYLISENKLGRKLFVEGCMKDVEKSLVATDMLPLEFHPPADILTVTVFCWTCTNLLKVKKGQPDELLALYDLPRRDYEDIVEILESSCQDVAARVRQKVSELSSKVKAVTGSVPTPSKRPHPDTPSKSPSKPSLRLPPVAAAQDGDDSPAKTPTHKRKVAFASGSGKDDADVLDTPSKRPRIASPTKRAYATVFELPTSSRAPLASTAKRSIFPNAVASSSRSTLELLVHTEKR